MATKKNIGVIECGNPGKSFSHHSMFHNQGTITKVYVANESNKNACRKNFPMAEFVHDTSSLISDHSIDLIIISGSAKKDVHLAAEIINAGKQVQLLTDTI